MKKKAPINTMSASSKNPIKTAACHVSLVSVKYHKNRNRIGNNKSAKNQPIIFFILRVLKCEPSHITAWAHTN